METITFLKRDTSDREGNALMSKQGKPYTRMTLKVESKGERYISGFGNQSNADWAIGDEVDIVITESATKDKTGKPYLNFTQPKKEDVVAERLELILNKLTGIQLSLGALSDKLVPKKASNYPVNDAPEPFPEEDTDSEIPF